MGKIRDNDPHRGYQGRDPLSSGSRRGGRPSKLALSDKEAIVARLAAGELGRTLASEFGVHANTISNIRKASLPRDADRPGPAARAALVHQFWAAVSIGVPTDCWPHASGSMTSYGSANKAVAGTRLPYRIAFILANERQPAGEVVRHLCDNKACCNPAHLLEGTRTENLADRGRRSLWLAQGNTGPTPVATPVPPPPQGWRIDIGDVSAVRRQKQLERLVNGARPYREACIIHRSADLHDHGSHGQFRLDGRTVQPAKAAWILTYGEDPGDQWVLHCCPGGAHGGCINVDHLILGTPAQNAAHTIADGRKPRGSTHPASKFTEQEVESLRQEHWEVGTSVAQLARRHAVVHGTMKSLLAGATYTESLGPTESPDAPPRRQRLTPELVNQARRLARSGHSTKALAARFETREETMRAAIVGDTWKNATEPPFRPAPGYLSDEQVAQLREEAARGISDATLAVEYGVSPAWAADLRRGKSRRSASGPITKTQLNHSQIRQIRDLFERGATREELRDRFEASKNQINDALAGRTGKNAGGRITPTFGRGKHLRTPAGPQRFDLVVPAHDVETQASG